MEYHAATRIAPTLAKLQRPTRHADSADIANAVSQVPIRHKAVTSVESDAENTSRPATQTNSAATNGAPTSSAYQRYFSPVYIGFMGVEAYGLVGLFIILQALAAVFELDIGMTLNRELARLSGAPGNEQRMRDVLRSRAVHPVPRKFAKTLRFSKDSLLLPRPIKRRMPGDQQPAA